jgi:hypothetical protein
MSSFVEGFFMANNDINLLMLARGSAIQAYANVEQSLCFLFSNFLGTTPELASFVFYKINNTRSRNTIMLDLFKRQYHLKKHEVFMKSALQFIRPLDQNRNEIVHWHALGRTTTSEAGVTTEVMLAPPNFWVMTKDANSHAKFDLDLLGEFSEKCNFISEILMMFFSEISPLFDLKTPKSAAWQQIFLEPVVHPAPIGHPLAQKPTGP